MKREELYREIGFIDENLIEAAEHSGIGKRKKVFLKSGLFWLPALSFIVQPLQLY